MNSQHIRLVSRWLIDRYNKTGHLPGDDIVFLRFAGRVPVTEMARGILEAREEIRGKGGGTHGGRALVDKRGG